ncbi:hypothetical protein FACS1894172_00640 [Spirochaetia bacterium]|nr:hypothetical protein FACS1894164_07430 [Spirochaetia bacterium]GHU29461.1 hypothetical protein FACS1894172_00640 [Spirochaetia bacterium]
MFIKRCFVIFFVSVATLSAQATKFPQIEPEPWTQHYAPLGKQATLSWQDVVAASLYASGVNESAYVRFEQTIRDAVTELRQDPDLPSDQRSRGNYILTYIHKKFFKKYVSGQTRIDVIVQSGTYNCVSSAVFYMIFALAAGMDVQGVMTHDHAFITINAGTASQPDLIDVETTNSYGFDPGNRREFYDSFGKTGFVYTPATNYRDRTNISQLELVSLILTNRMAEIERKRDFTNSIPVAANFAALLSQRAKPVNSPIFPDPQKTLTDRLNNFGLTLLNSGKEADAISWAHQTQAFYPDNQWQHDLIYKATYNYVVKSAQKNQFNPARLFLTAQSPDLTPDELTKIETVLVESELVRKSTQLKTLRDTENFLQDVESAQSVLSAARLSEMRTLGLLKKAEFISSGQGSLEAIAFLESAIAQYGRNANLDKGLQMFQTNRVAELHNSFAGQYNSGDFNSARITILNALQEFPDNRQLRQDKAIIDRIQNQ